MKGGLTDLSDYEIYLEKYCKTYGVTKADAEKHYLVQAVKHYYEEEERKNRCKTMMQ